MKVKIGIIGGSGLDNPDILKNRTEKTVTTIFGSPSDALIEGEIEGVPCVLLARHGRKHTIMPGNVNYRANVWALKEAGCTHLVVSTATGSLQEHISRGDFVILDSFIDRTQGRKQTFYDGQPNSPVGVCHIQMEPAFCPRTRQIIIEAAKELGLRFHEKGTVVAIEGPRFSSKAESLMFRQWGGHVINMTTVPEFRMAQIEDGRARFLWAESDSEEEEREKRSRFLWAKDSSSEDEENVRAGPAPRIFRERMDHYERWNDKEFRQRYRLRKDTGEVF